MSRIADENEAESAPWRDVYLTAAYELGHGAPEKGERLGR